MGFLETQGHSNSGRNFISDEDGIRMGPGRDCAQTIPVIPNNPDPNNLIQFMWEGSNRNTFGFGESEIYGFKTFRI